MFNRFPEKLAPYGPTVLRVMVGITFFFNGLPKLQNIPGNVNFLASLGVPLPQFFGPLVAIMETFGGILLILGLGTRVLSLYYVGEMIMTSLLVKSKVGFIAPRGGGAGAELDLTILAAALALFLLGSGALSIEWSILKRELWPGLHKSTPAPIVNVGRATTVSRMN